MEKIMEIKHNNDVFVINGEFDTTGEYGILEPVEVEVFKNGKAERNFGETFAGQKVSDMDFADQSLRAYMNDNKQVEFVFVHDKIAQYKKDEQTYNDKGIPEKWFRDCYECHLVAYSDECAYYMDNDGREDYVCTNIEDNSVLTDYECFFTVAIVDDFNDNNLTFTKHSLAEDTKEWLKDYVKED